MSTFYLKQGNIFKVTDARNLDIRDHLPAETFVLKANQEGFFLDTVSDFDIEGKVYGDVETRADRIMQTFSKRPNATGLLLNGEKGSGKTLLAKILSRRFAQAGCPTILINQPWHGDGFNSFMQTIAQPCIVIFDEFEKVYDREQQESVLTLFDGVFPSKKLFVVTCNDKYRINEHMQNRPGRFFYALQYDGMSEEFIREYTIDKLKNQDHVENVVRFSAMFSKFNFDILKALIEEMNRYDEDVKEAATMLNAIPDLNKDSVFELTAFINGKPIKTDTIHSTKLNNLDPRFNGFRLSVKNPNYRKEEKLKERYGENYYPGCGEEVQLWEDDQGDIPALIEEAKEQNAGENPAWLHFVFAPYMIKSQVYEGGATVIEMEHDDGDGANASGVKVLLRKKPPAKGYNYFDYL